MPTTRYEDPEILEPRRGWRDHTDKADIEKLAVWLDTKYVLPGTNWRFGFDSIIGLVPGVGDAVTTLLGAYIIVRARELGAPPHLQAAMVGNLLIDTLVGAVPLLGDAFDFAFRSNAKNVQLLKSHLDKQTMRRVNP